MRFKPALTADEAAEILTACKQEAVANGWAVSIAIVDDAGYLLAFARLDGANPPSCSVATEKARTASLWRKDTGYWENRVTQNPTYAGLPDNLPVEGGVPLFFKGECVGAVGVSGVKSDQDAQIARAGAKLLEA